MKMKHMGMVLAGVGTLYLVAVSWLLSWWYVPVLREGGTAAAAFGGSTFFLVWAGSGALGAAMVAVGVAVFSAIGRTRLLALSAGLVVLLGWITMWSTASHHAAVFGVGGGLILFCFLATCLDWARTRRNLGGARTLAVDLRLAGHVCFFIAAWGLCGLLGAPVFALRSDLGEVHGSSAVASTLATKVLVSLVLGWGLTALSQREERRQAAVLPN